MIMTTTFGVSRDGFMLPEIEMVQNNDDRAALHNSEVYHKILGDLDRLAMTLTDLGEEAAADNVRLSRDHMMTLHPHRMAGGVEPAIPSSCIKMYDWPATVTEAGGQGAIV
jgi:hypothetical protein